MASREEELKELAELEELAQLEALAAQEAGKMPPTQEGLNIVEQGLAAAMPVLDPLGRVIDVATLGAPIRAGVAKLVEAQTGKEIAPEKKLLSGQAPSFSEIWEAQGIGPGASLSELIPGVFSPTGEGLPLKKGGMFDVTPRGVLGGVMDIATGGISGPVKALAKAVPGASQLSKVAKALPSKYSIMSTLSGVPEEAIETFSKNKQIISELDPIKAAELAEQATNDARKLVSQTRSEAGKALDTAIRQSGAGNIDIANFKDQLYKKLMGSVGDLDNKANQQIAQGIKSELDTIFKVDVPETLPDLMGMPQPTGRMVTKEISNQLKATELFDLKNQLKDMGDLYGGKPGIVSKQAAAKVPVSDKRLQTSLLDAVKELDSMIDDATKGASKEARAAYAEQAAKARNIDRYFSTPERAMSTLSNLSSKAKGPTRRAIQQADELFGTNIEETGKILESAKYFNEPSIEALSGAGTTSTSRTLGGAAVGSALGSVLGGPGGAALGAAVGSKAASPWAIKNVYLPAIETAGATGRLPGALASKLPPEIMEPIRTVSEAPAQVWLKLLQEQKRQGEQK